MTQPAISRHLKVLEGAGLISVASRAPAAMPAVERRRLSDRPVAGDLRKALAKNYDRLDEVSLAGMKPETAKREKTMRKLTMKTEGDTHVGGDAATSPRRPKPCTAHTPSRR